MAKMNGLKQTTGPMKQQGTSVGETMEFEVDLYPYFARKTLRKLVPFYAFVEITARCNFRCVHCQTSYSSRKKELTSKEICSVLDQLADIGTFGLNITGGEPLVHPDFFKIVEHAKRREFVIRLCTNGFLITKAIAERLAKLYLMEIYISIYGMDERTTNAVTGVSGACQRVLDNARLLIDKGLRVLLRMPLLREDIGQIERLERFARDIGADFAPVPKIHARFDRCQSPLDHLPTVAQLESYLGSYPEHCRPSSVIPGSDQSVCTAGSGLIGISAYGDIMGCPFLRGECNIRDHSIASAIKNDPFIKRARELRWRDLPECLRCKQLVHCRPCPGLFHLENDTLTQPAATTVCRLSRMKKKLYDESARP